jgi:hypothetical protein
MYTYEVFSNWLFVWSLFNYLKIIESSPLIFIMIGLFFYIIKCLITKKIKIYNFLFKFISVIMIFKTPIITEYDLIFGFFLAYIYIIVLLYSRKNPIDVYMKILKGDEYLNRKLIKDN